MERSTSLLRKETLNFAPTRCVFGARGQASAIGRNEADRNRRADSAGRI
jgi:hypothetical protein